MTPKEKAIELFNKMDMIIYTDQDNWKSQCIRCAIVAVDEIIKAIDFDWMEIQNLESEHRYWEQVKNEIEKL